MDFFFWFATIAVIIVAYRFLMAKAPKDLKGKVVLITGGGSGIGRLMAHSFADEGCAVVLWDISKDGLDTVKKEITSKGSSRVVYTYNVDVTDRDAIAKTVEIMNKNIGNIDILVNNAGVVAGKYFWELTHEQIDRVFKVNTLGPMNVTKAFLPAMMEKNSGHLVTIASAAATVGTAKLADYCASKWAVFGWAESLRIETALAGKDGIKHTLVCPFYINTGMFDGVKTGNPLLPILDPKYVVAEIMNAVKTEKEEIYLPNIVMITYLSRLILPTVVRDSILRIMGVSRAMSDFQGQRQVK